MKLGLILGGILIIAGIILSFTVSIYAAVLSIAGILIAAGSDIIKQLQTTKGEKENFSKESEHKKRKLEEEVYTPVLDEIPEVLESIRKWCRNIHFESIDKIYLKTPWLRLEGTELLRQLNKLRTELTEYNAAWEGGRKYCEKLIDNNFSKFKSEPKDHDSTGTSTVSFISDSYPLFIDKNRDGLKEKIQRVLRDFREDLVHGFKFDGLEITIYLTKKDQFEEGIEKTFAEFIESKERDNLVEAANKLDNRIYPLQTKLKNLINEVEELK